MTTMPWRKADSLYIFAPDREPFGMNWVEQILGAVVRPLQQRYTSDIRWLWATRYVGSYDAKAPPGGYALPQEYHSDGHYRFLLFRMSLTDAWRREAREEGLKLAAQAGCFTNPTGWTEYDVVMNLGSVRFVTRAAATSVRVERARLIAAFVDATVRLVLAALEQDADGKWTSELTGFIGENPHGSFLESVHHIFCNLTGVPTAVLLRRHQDDLHVGTHWMQPRSVPMRSIPSTRSCEVAVHF